MFVYITVIVICNSSDLQNKNMMALFREPFERPSYIQFLHLKKTKNKKKKQKKKKM